MDDIDGVPDQSPEALQKCYTYSGAPISVENDPQVALSLEQAVLYYGLRARERVFCSALHRRLSVVTAEEALAAFRQPAPMREFIWFCFGQKIWTVLSAISQQADAVLLRAIGPEVWDLFFMARLRQNRPGFLNPALTHALEKAISSFTKDFRRIWPQESIRAPFYAALLAHIRGDIDGARQTIASLPHKSDLCGPLRAVSSILPPEARRPADQSQIEILARAAAPNALLLACDETYFRLYFSALARSFRELPSVENWGIHIHCVGFDPRDHPTFDGCFASVGITLDKTPLPVSPPNWKAAYCASARYIYAPLYMEHYDRLLVSDIDGLFFETPNQTWTGSTGDDVVFSSRTLKQSIVQLSPLPWNTIAAGCTLFNDTPGGRTYATQVASYLAAIFQNDGSQGTPNEELQGSPWFADQNALFFSFHDMCEDLRVSRFNPIPFKQAGTWKQFTGDEAKARFIKKSP